MQAKTPGAAAKLTDAARRVAGLDQDNGSTDDATHFAGLAEVDATQPIDQRHHGAPLVKATGRSERDIAYSDFIHIVRYAERLVYEAKTALELQSEIDNARRQQAHRQHTDPNTIRRIKTLADAWAIQAGITDENGAGS